METQRFDLDLALATWRSDMAHEGGLAPDVILELESHLREAIAGWEQRGLTPDEAFLVATRRLGPPGSLALEFAKVRPQDVWRVRCGWMLAGLVLYHGVFSMAAILSHAVMWAGTYWSLEPLALGWLGLLAWGGVIGTGGFAFFAAARGRCSGADQLVDWGLRKPLTRLFELGALLVLLAITAQAMQVLSVRQFAPRQLGAIYLVLTWGKALGALAVVPLLFAAAAWLLRRMPSRINGPLALWILAFALWNAPSPRVQAQSPGASDATASRSDPVSVDRALKLWKAGQHEEAVRSFLAIDFARDPLFPADSPLAYSERQFVDLPAPVREKVHPAIVAETRILKELGGAVRDRGQAAARAGRSAEAEKHLGALRRCGEALGKPDRLQLLQLVGKGLKKAAAPP